MGAIKTAELLAEIEKSVQSVRSIPEIRKVSAQFFPLVKNNGLDAVLTICEDILQLQRGRQSWVIAFDWAYRMKKEYTRDTWPVFERWLREYVRDWDSCDDFCSHAFGELLAQYNDFFDRVISWTEHPDFWVRRAAAVILIYPIRKKRADKLDPFLIADKLMHDDHYLVQKGYGWLLKVVSQHDEDAVVSYLLKHKENMPRLAFRYATEKMPKERRDFLLDIS